MNRSESIDKLVTALAAAQAGLSAPPKNRTVNVKTKTGGSYEFSYTTLDCIIEHVRLALTSNGIWFTQTVENTEGRHRLITTLLHSSGQWLASETPLMPSEGGNQAFGSALTYMKRYALAAMLGIASDDDDDGNEADGNTIQSRSDRTPAPRQAAPAKIAAPIGKGGVTTTSEWFKNQTASIRTMQTLSALRAWEAENEDRIGKLKTLDPKRADELEELLGDMRSKLRNFGIAAE